MKTGIVLTILVAISLCGNLHSQNQSLQRRIVRLAELEIDPAQIAAYKAALKEEIDTSLRVEPGVLSLNAVSLKDQPNQIRILETYASQAAYDSHIRSLHFLKYKAATQSMVKSLRLFETEPITLGSKVD